MLLLTDLLRCTFFDNVTDSDAARSLNNIARTRNHMQSSVRDTSCTNGSGEQIFIYKTAVL